MEVWSLELVGDSACVSSLHTACVVRLRPCERRRDFFCGRKKLPFAGYSVVKERPLKLPAISLSASSPGGRFRGSFSPNSGGLIGSGAAQPTVSHLTTRDHRDQAGLFDFCPRRSACQPGAHSRTLPAHLRLHSGAKVGEYRARTGDLLVANQALSQLS